MFEEFNYNFHLILEWEFYFSIFMPPLQFKNMEIPGNRTGLFN